MKRRIRWVLEHTPEFVLWMLVMFVALSILYALIWFGMYSLGLRH